MDARLSGDPEAARLARLGRKVRKRLDASPAARRIAADEAELWAVPKFLDPLECGRLIAMIDAVARPSRTFEVDAANYRTSYTGEIPAGDPFVAALNRRIDALLGIDPAWGEAIQGQRYTAGQEFKPHVDFFPPGTRTWDKEQALGGQRSMTAMAYLNPVEEGGETDFPRLDLAVPPRPGMLLVWNNADPQGLPNPFTLHAGNPVIRGTKHVITKWYRAAPWIMGSR